MKRNKAATCWLIAFLIAFIYIIMHSFGTDYKFYIADSLVAIAVIAACYIFYEKFHMNSLAFACIGIGLFLHTSGAFGFYANPPVPWEWDLTTHVFGFFSVATWIYSIMSDYMTANGKKTAWFFFGVIFITMGAGVVVEFLEFGGFAMAGFEEGFLGRGPGDIQGDWISGDYWDTIVDLWYNLIGALAGFIVAYFGEKSLYRK